MKKKMLQKKFRVIANQRIKDGYFKLTLDAGKIASLAKPGQFLMLSLNSDTLGTLLRRPMSIHSANKNKVDILYEAKGQGTRILSGKESGEYLDVIGPLGSGFEIAKNDAPDAILVAGGVGVAPLLFLAEKLLGRERKILVLIGAKTKGSLLCEKEFKQLGCEVKTSTDDGSKGFRGKVADVLNKVLPLAISDKRLAIYACGPSPMLKQVSYIASNYRIEAWGSFEEHLACGIGACMGCVIKAQNEKATACRTPAGRPGQAGKTQNDFVYKRVCKEGPVFALSQIVWGRE